MKNIILVISILTAVFGCSQKKTGWSRFHLRGKVKSVTESQHKAEEKFGEPTFEKGIIDFSLLAETVFNKNGDPIETNSYVGNRNLYGKRKINLDQDGRVINWVSYDGQGKQITRADYRWESSTRATITTPCSSSSGGKNELTFNSSGDTDKSIFIDCKGITLYSFQYKYDAKGNAMELHFIQPDKPESVTMYEYDSDGNTISEQSGDKQTDIKYKYTQPDQIGNWTVAYKMEVGKPMRATVREIVYY